MPKVKAPKMPKMPKTLPSPNSGGCCLATTFLCLLLVVVVLVYALRYYNSTMRVQQEGFANATGESSCYTMGPYDGVTLTTDPKTYELQVPTRQNATVQGYQVPLRQPYPGVVAHSEYYPSVDGTANTPKSLFMFSHNQSHPDCCPSTFSTSTGCVCTTPQQRRWLYMRGQPEKQ